jgi:hypothetical protein
MFARVHRRSGALSVDAGAAEKLSPLVSGSPTVRSAPTGGHRATGITSSWRQSARGSGQAATLATRRGGAEAPLSIVHRLAMPKRRNSNLRVPSDGGIDDACPARTATP